MSKKPMTPVNAVISLTDRVDAIQSKYDKVRAFGYARALADLGILDDHDFSMIDRKIKATKTQ